ncbi:MAG: hypothetical protein RM049_10785 [Nostoc sp. DedQUE04]|uniref:hypothetical protein n=1 Tax=Nostoc sp. DedQUE04 TaxID=3075390 RepID=UPI002AD4D745|nr:hypothetical protein [Nostoc sp. DedQUE04]MDZ8135772.1 hypothetical protein [Nostoc sp. DedQUE04]
MLSFFHKHLTTWTVGAASLLSGYILYQIPVFANTPNTNRVLLTAQPKKDPIYRVKFAPGSSSTVIKSSVRFGKKDTYVFHARKGQTIIALVTWNGQRADGNNDEQGLSGFTFVPPSGEAIVDPQDDRFTATSTGDYKVIVAQPYRLTSPKYTFELAIR